MSIHYAYSTVSTPNRDVSGDHDNLEALALEYADKALSLDPDLPVAYSAIAEVHKFFWRWVQADRACRRGLQLSPNDAGLLANYAWFNVFSGRYAEAIRLAERAVTLAPSNAGARFHSGTVYAYAGMMDLAAADLTEAVRLSPTTLGYRLWLAHVEAIRGNDSVALAAIRKNEEVLGENFPAIVAAILSYAYWKLDQPQDAQRLSDKVQAMAVDNNVGAGTMAIANLAKGTMMRRCNGYIAQLKKLKTKYRMKGSTT